MPSSVALVLWSFSHFSADWTSSASDCLVAFRFGSMGRFGAFGPLLASTGDLVVVLFTGVLFHATRSSVDLVPCASWPGWDSSPAPPYRIQIGPGAGTPCSPQPMTLHRSRCPFAATEPMSTLR